VVPIGAVEHAPRAGERFELEVHGGSGCAAELHHALEALRGSLDDDTAKEVRAIVTVLLVEGMRDADTLVGHRISIMIELLDDRLRVRVQDRDADLLAGATLREQLSSVLYLMSDQWGTGTDGNGRFLWFETPLAEPGLER
jgi:hypothetical protein